MANMVLGLLIYAVEFAKLFPLMFWVLEFKLKPVRQVVLYSIITAAVAAVGGLFAGEHTGLLSSVMCVIGTILILKGKYKVPYVVVVYMGICMFDMLAASIALLFLEENYVQLTNDNPLNLAMNSICIAVVLIITLTARRIKRYAYGSSEQRVSVFYLIMILAGEISVLMFITGFQMLNSDSKFFSVILSISSIAFIMLSVVMIFNHISKSHYKNTAEINRKLLSLQENYYTMLLKKDNETIKFRHDINNHLNCMHRLFKSGKSAELEDYFEKLCGSLSELRPVVQTGNDMVSAILNDMVSRYPEVGFKIEGRLPDKLNLSNMDICTIFSNLFDNAFKAAEASQNKAVEIYFKFAGAGLLCEKKNSVDRRAEIINNELQTDKDDKINHGHGSGNARKCAEKNEGALIFRCTDEYFLAELMLPVLR